MPCNPHDNTLNPIVSPGIAIPGLPGLPTSPVQLPDFEFPEGFPEDLLDLINRLQALFPSGIFKPNLDDAIHTVLTALASLFNQIAPYLSFYHFIMALLNMVLCIIEVLCSFYNVRKTLRALKRLFKVCLPNFLAMFPWAALLAMILALLLLILALIQYIIEKLLALIEDLLRNIRALGSAITLNDDDAQEAIAIKIASLLCLIEGLFSVFAALAAIFAIINSLAAMAGFDVCGDDNSILGNITCCDDEVCPPFVDDHPDAVISDTNGMLIYYNHISPGFDATDNFSRAESWQFVNNNNSSYPLKDIITSYGADDFWPEGKTYNGQSSLTKVPYTVDFTIPNFDPSFFHPSDHGGARNFIVQNAVVSIRPYIGTYDELNDIEYGNSDGTFKLLGGIVYDGEVGNTYYVNNKAATLETFIHKAGTYDGEAPDHDDGYYFQGLHFDWKFSHEVLADNRLITIGCIPDLKYERAALAARYADKRPVLEQVPALADGNIIPDYSKLQACADAAMATLRQDVSEDNIEAYRTAVLACLDDAQTQTEQSYKNILTVAVNVFESTVAIDPEVQFVTRPITVTVVLKDVNGGSVAANVPASVQSDIADLIEGSVTFGEISDFTYDGYVNFTAEITSEVGGDGVLTVSFNNNEFQNVLNLNNDNPTSFETNSLSYTFVGIGTVGQEDQKERRDATDIARNES